VTATSRSCAVRHRNRFLKTVYIVRCVVRIAGPPGHLARTHSPSIRAAAGLTAGLFRAYRISAVIPVSAKTMKMVLAFPHWDILRGYSCGQCPLLLRIFSHQIPNRLRHIGQLNCWTCWPGHSGGNNTDHVCADKKQQGGTPQTTTETPTSHAVEL